jgi:hypothetical protein
MSLGQPRRGNDGPNTDNRGQGSNPWTVGGKIFGADLGAAQGVLKRTHTALNPGLDSSKMRALATGERVKINDRNNQIGTGPASFLAGHVVPPSEAGGYRPAAPTSMASHTENTDAPIPIVRFLAAPNMYELPGDRQCVFIKKPTTPSQRLRPGVAGPRPGAGVANPNANSIQARAHEWADGNTMQAKHVYALNQFLVEEQYKLLLTNPKRYSSLSASEIWHGCADLPWTGWFHDGVCRLEEITGGKSSKFDDGYGSVRTLGRLGKGVGPNGVQKTMSVVRAGRVSMQNVFQSRGITRNATLYWVLTKRKWGYKDTHTPASLHFVHTTKADVLTTQFNSVNRNFQPKTLAELKLHPHTDPEQQQYLQALEEPFMGYMLYPLAVPDSGSPDSSFYMCEKDEWGRKHRPALVMRFGRVLFEPFRFQPQETIHTADMGSFKPATDGRHAMMEMPFPDILLDACKDGLFAMI